MRPADPSDRVKFDDGEMFDYVGDEERILSQIEQLSPGDVDGYRKLAAHSRKSSISDIPKSRGRPIRYNW